MKTYIAFLRAINVGGRFIKMEQLRQYFVELGLSNVKNPRSCQEIAVQ